MERPARLAGEHMTEELRTRVPVALKEHVLRTAKTLSLPESELVRLRALGDVVGRASVVLSPRLVRRTHEFVSALYRQVSALQNNATQLLDSPLSDQELSVWDKLSRDLRVSQVQLTDLVDKVAIAEDLQLLRLDFAPVRERLRPLEKQIAEGIPAEEISIVGLATLVSRTVVDVETALQSVEYSCSDRLKSMTGTERDGDEPEPSSGVKKVRRGGYTVVRARATLAEKRYATYLATMNGQKLSAYLRDRLASYSAPPVLDGANTLAETILSFKEPLTEHLRELGETFNQVTRATHRGRRVGDQAQAMAGTIRDGLRLLAEAVMLIGLETELLILQADLAALRAVVGRLHPDTDKWKKRIEKLDRVADLRSETARKVFGS